MSLLAPDDDDESPPYESDSDTQLVTPFQTPPPAEASVSNASASSNGSLAWSASEDGFELLVQGTLAASATWLAGAAYPGSAFAHGVGGSYVWLELAEPAPVFLSVSYSHGFAMSLEGEPGSSLALFCDEQERCPRRIQLAPGYYELSVGFVATVRATPEREGETETISEDWFFTLSLTSVPPEVSEPGLLLAVAIVTGLRLVSSRRRAVPS